MKKKWYLWIIKLFWRRDVDKYITTPLNETIINNLNAGDYVYITGTIYSARDAAHKRMYESILKGEEIPFDIKNSIVYYLGPTPEREGQVIGSAGPTTSSRMDKYTPLLMEHGLKGMIGKGKRSGEVIDSIIKYKGVYLAAVGGAGALLSKKIIRSKIIGYEELGTEAIREMYVEEFPTIVVIDSKGNNLYETAVKEFSC